VTDGDGTFHFSKTKQGIWSFTFKIGQSNYNLRLLYYIKSMIGIGSVSVHNSKDNTAEFRIRNIQHIIEYIIPIFDTFPLLTSKYFHYKLFRDAILIMNDYTLTKEEKDKQISQLKSQTMPDNYYSPAWDLLPLLPHLGTQKQGAEQKQGAAQLLPSQYHEIGGGALLFPLQQQGKQGKQGENENVIGLPTSLWLN